MAGREERLAVEHERPQPVPGSEPRKLILGPSSPTASSTPRSPMPRQVLLLLPEHVPQDADLHLPAPEYAEVINDDEAERVRVALLLGDQQEALHGKELWLPRASVYRSMVWSGELTSDAPGRLLRRPVLASIDTKLVHGQVVGYDGRILNVRHAGGTAEVQLDQVEEVAPVIAFLLFRSDLLRHSATANGLATAHKTILDRLLGLEGSNPTRSISGLLTGIAARHSFPSPGDTVLWCSPRSGADRLCSVGHVVNYGYFVDGNQAPSRSVALGEHYCDDPTILEARPSGDGPSKRRTKARSRESTPDSLGEEANPVHASDNLCQSARTQFADLLDSLEPEDPDTDGLSLPVAFNQADTDPTLRPKRKTNPATSPMPSLSAPVQIMAALAKHPALLEHYADQLSQLDAVTKRPRLDSISDSRPAPSSNDDREHSFRPSQSQQIVHRLLTSAEHIGKSPSTFIEFARSSRATKFIPHPAIMSRLFDFQFGVCGLSILHFRRFDLNAQLEYASGSTVNLRNFSVKVDLPKIPPAPSHEHILAALAILGTFAQEFFDEATRRLIVSARDFAEELNDYAPWSADEVKALAYWFSSVLGAYRLAAEHDATHGSSTRTEIRHRFSMQDAELNGLVLRMSRFRANTSHVRGASELTPRRDHGEGPHHGRSNGQNTKAAAKRPVPNEVALAAPRQSGKQLCLRFLSARGCPSGSAEKCTHPFLNHFVPSTKLDPRVRGYVVERLGGLRPEFEHL